MIEVLIGTDRMVEQNRDETRTENASFDELMTMAAGTEVLLDDDPDKELLAARLSALSTKVSLPGLRVLTCRFPEDMPVMEIAATLTIPKGVWDQWSPGAHEDSGVPTWVWSSSPAVQLVLAEHFGCEEGIPSDVEDTHYTENGPPGVGGTDPVVGVLGATIGLMMNMLLLLMSLGFYLRVDAGKDFQSRVMADTASTGTGTYAAANWIALTETATAPAAGDTALTGELTAFGLARAQAAYAHGAGASTYTLTKTFTSSDATARTLQKIGVFNASTAGTMAFETAIPSPPQLVSGDQVAITETVTI